MLNCEKCGDLEFAYIDGYDVAERLLEGVMFEIRFVGKKANVKVREYDKDYFEQFNEPKWLQAIKELAEEEDNLICPKCQDHIGNGGIGTSDGKPKPIGIPVNSIDDIIKGIK